jgi:hypothetical protein
MPLGLGVCSVGTSPDRSLTMVLWMTFSASAMRCVDLLAFHPGGSSGPTGEVLINAGIGQPTGFFETPWLIARPSPCQPSRPAAHDLAQALLAYSPAPPEAIPGNFCYFFRASGLHAGWPLPVAVGPTERGPWWFFWERARVARIRSPRRGGPQGRGVDRLRWHRTLDLARRGCLHERHVARPRCVPSV